MKYRRLGKTGLRVSVIGVGTWQYGGEWGKEFQQAEVDAILAQAAELGPLVDQLGDGDFLGQLRAAPLGVRPNTRIHYFEDTLRARGLRQPYVVSGPVAPVLPPVVGPLSQAVLARSAPPGDSRRRKDRAAAASGSATRDTDGGAS